MRSFLPLLRRFGRDERGAFIALFAAMALSVTALTGAAVDYTHIEQERNRAQIALDSAALTLQPRIYDMSEEEILAAARALLEERMGGSVENWVNSVEIDQEEGTLRLTAGIRVPMAFVRLVGIEEMTATLVSEATRKRLALEVAMVLDNSGSMLEQNRIGHLKNAAACATLTLLYDEVNDRCDQPASGARQVEDVRIGIVPFTMFVNVGTENRTAYWLDWAGQAPLSNDNFEPNDNGRVNRTTLFNSLRRSNGQAVEWAGCVIAREYPHDTLDTVPPLGVPAANPEALFTPLFAPDERDGYPNSYLSDTGGTCQPATCTRTVTRNNCTTNWRGQISCTGGSSTSYTRVQNGVTTNMGATSCIMANAAVLEPTSGRWNGNRYIETTVYSMFTDRQLQERTCKYGSTSNRVTVNASATFGPNAHCPSISILPLSDNPNAVIGRIQAMVADGGTNIQQGAAWGWHVLSPDAPFEEGNPYDQATSKVMILMTDGENYNSWQNYNSNMNGTYYYGAYGHRWNDRLAGNASNNNQMISAMNVRTEETCRNAKAAGISIYSIGLAVPNDATRTMMRNCATTADHAYFPDDPSELLDVFESIANELSALRLSQ